MTECVKIKCDDCKFVEDCVDYGWDGCRKFTPTQKKRNTQETTELKPCPFCGSKAEVWEGVFGGWRAFCTNRKSCGAMIVCATKQDAIREWNRRTKCVN